MVGMDAADPNSLKLFLGSFFFFEGKFLCFGNVASSIKIFVHFLQYNSNSIVYSEASVCLFRLHLLYSMLLNNLLLFLFFKMQYSQD